MLYDDKHRRQKSEQGTVHICDKWINLVYLVFAGSMLTAPVGPATHQLVAKRGSKETGQRTTEEPGKVNEGQKRKKEAKKCRGEPKREISVTKK